MTPLSRSALATISQTVPVPTYRRDLVNTGIVHIGVGGFHRSHEAMYVDLLMQRGGSLEWGITGVGLLPGDRHMAEVMRKQDCLYTLILKHPDGSLEPRVIGSIVDYLFAPERPDDVLGAMVAPSTRIISLTITEGGYHLNQVTGDFDATAPEVQHDLAPDVAPRTAFGFIAEALARRRAEGTPPFTVMSCDNIPGNGGVTRRMLTSFTSLKDPELAAWIGEHVRFPDSMVDRITPVTTDEDRHHLAQHFGVQDEWPVVCEPWTQWVLTDDFESARPDLEDVGVQVVGSVEPYELMKLRLLNASHQAMCYLGYLAGYRFAHEVCADPLFVGFLNGYMEAEATPTLPEVPGVDLVTYREQLITRFANPHVRDTLARLCAESSDRIPKWLIPVVHDQLLRGGEVRRAALVVAAWARYAEGVDEEGEPIEIVDARRDQLLDRARRQSDDPLAFLRDQNLFGSLVDEPRFTDPYLKALRLLHEDGARATLEAWVDSPTR
ncbi:MAG: mannitol 2-dehydrogenase [Nocardioidaceae bacterium]|nr:mannitol 2-dehydrogenase [Nocardioidaceae bacterium]